MNWQDEQKKVATGVTGKREWVSLTSEEYLKIADETYNAGSGLVAFYFAIEAKLKEKNSCNL
jgi:hypothetical protein